MVSYTPGPWKVYDPNDSSCTYGIDGANGEAVVFYGDNRDSSIRKYEDALLIAAAPELLAACQSALRALTRYDDFNEDECDRAVKLLSESIAKATDACPPTPRTDRR